MDYLIINLIIILGIGVLGAFFSESYERGFGAVLAMGIAASISLWGWAFFIAHHFIVRYW